MWELILKSQLGNIQERFRKDDIPTIDEIEAMPYQERSIAYKHIDTGITNIESQYKSSLSGTDIPNTVVTQMITGKRTKVAESRKEALKIIANRISEWKKLTSDSVNTLHTKTVGDITFGELVSPEGKSNKEWTIETLNTLYQMMVDEPTVELLYALQWFIHTSTNGIWRKGNRWPNNMGRESIEDPDPQALKNIFSLRLEPEVEGGVDKKVFDFFTDKYKYTTEGLREITLRRGHASTDEENPGLNLNLKESSAFSKRGGYKERTKKIGERVVMTEKKSIELIMPENLIGDLEDLTETEFTGLINNLNKNKVSESSLIRALKTDAGIKIFYNLVMTPITRSLNFMLRDIDIRRKGHSTTQRKSDYLHDWAVDYINRKRGEAEENGEDDFTIADYTMLTPKRVIEINNEKDSGIRINALNENKKSRRKALAWIKKKVKDEDDTWAKRFENDIQRRRTNESKYNELTPEEKETMTPDEIREFMGISDEQGIGVGFKSLQYGVTTEHGISDFVNDLEGIPANARYYKNMFSLLFSYYMDGGKQGVLDNSAELITSKSEFQNYVPSSATTSTTKTSFIKSIKALLTYINLLHGSDSVTEYNSILDERIIPTFTNNLHELFKTVSTDEDIPLEDKTAIFDEIVSEDLIPADMKSSWFGTKTDFETIYNILNSLLEGDMEGTTQSSKEKMVKILSDDIDMIAKDKDDKYSTIREYLIKKKILILPKPPMQIMVGDIPHTLDKNSNSNSLDGELIYYPFERNKAKGSEGILINEEKPHTTSLRKILGDEE